MGHAFSTSLVIECCLQTHPIRLFLQTQRGFLLFCVVDRGVSHAAFASQWLEPSDSTTGALLHEPQGRPNQSCIRIIWKLASP
jgi:hypothetical protein